MNVVSDRSSWRAIACIRAVDSARILDHRERVTAERIVVEAEHVEDPEREPRHGRDARVGACRQRSSMR
jgi:hypothetical protein